MTNRLPEKLTKLRKHLGFSQAEVAKMCLVPVEQYMNFENGNQICSIYELQKIAQIFDVDIIELLDNTVEVTLPELSNEFDSVQIPFANIPKSEDFDGDTLQATKGFITNDPELEKTMMQQIVAESADEAKKTKKKVMIYVAIAAVILILVVFLVTFLLKKKPKQEETTVAKVSLSEVNRLALATNGTIWITDNKELKTYGSLKLDNFDHVVQVSAFRDHILGLKEDGTVVCQGNSCDVRAMSDVTMVASGLNHSVVLKSDGTVLCTGKQDACAVGDWKDIEAVYAGIDVTVGKKKDGTLVTSGKLPYLSNLQQLKDVKDVALGSKSACVVTKAGGVSCYTTGSDTVINTEGWSNIKKVVITNDFVAALGSDGKLYVSSTNTDLVKNAGALSGLVNIAGYDNTLVALKNDGNLVGLGDNSKLVYPVDDSSTPTPNSSQLSAVTNVQFSSTPFNVELSWNKVENAGYYLVKVDTAAPTEIKSVKNSASISVDKLEVGKEYTFTIVAMPEDEKTYVASMPTTMKYTYQSMAIDKVTNVQYESLDGKVTISWDAVNNASSYSITLDGKTQETSTNKIEFESVSAGEKTLKIIAKSSDPKKYGNSEEYSSTITVKSERTTLDTPQGLSISHDANGWIVSWNAVNNAVAYELSVGDVVVAQQVVGTQYVIDKSKNIGGQAYTVKLKAIGDQTKFKDSAMFEINYTFPALPQSITTQTNGG